MKRRATKKYLHDAEIMMLDSLHFYITEQKNKSEDDPKKLNNIGMNLVSLSFSMLLSFHLQLDPNWPNNRQWIKKLTLNNISIKDGNINGKGEIIWGELIDNREIFKTGDFSCQANSTNIRPKDLKYALTFKLDSIERTIRNFQCRF